MNYLIVVGLLVGGVLAAPIAAWLVRHMPPRVLGAAAGGLIVLTNGWLLLRLVGASPGVVISVYVVLGALAIVGVASASRSVLARRDSAATLTRPPTKSAPQRRRTDDET